MGLRARTLHETGNWFVLTDCSNAPNTVKTMAMLAEAANCVPAFTPFAAKCYPGMAQDPMTCSFGWTLGRSGR